MPDNNNLEYIIRQARLFHSIEDFIKLTNQPEYVSGEYGYNIPMEYDIILGIYHEVNQDLRNKDDLSLRSSMIYDRKHSHGKKKTKN